MNETQATTIQVEHVPSRDRLETLQVFSWPTWRKEVSTFPWTYDATEICYLLTGDVVVTPLHGEPVTIGAGDLVTFPAGMSCTWDIRAEVHKHYRFD